MEIPKNLKIGGHNYKIIFPYTFTERYDRCGDCEYSDTTIRIAESSYEIPRAKSAIIVTLIHEVLHAIDNLTGHGIFEGNGGEAKVEALSEGIYQVLIDNKYITE